ncbi:hypothetical protein HQ586_03935 [Candidatus Bathyarchaeota archaeon]|nr:hypothetical protein [Candidatus Bathyarchaeota archaeon]
MSLKISSRIKLAARSEGRESTLVRIGDVVIGGEKVVVIAGPCSVESREQLMEAARAVKTAGASMLRGGAYKPRAHRPRSRGGAGTSRPCHRPLSGRSTRARMLGGRTR